MLKRCLKVLFSILVACLIIGSFVSPHSTAQRERAGFEDIYYTSEGEKVTLNVSLDQIGVLVKEGMTEKDLLVVLRPYNLRISRRYTGGLYILTSGRRLEREALVKLAREIKAKSEKVVSQAGLVVMTRQSRDPSVATDEFIAKFKANVGKDEIESLNRENGVEVVMANPFVKNQFLLRVTDASKLDSLRMALRYRESKLVEYAYPNFINVYVDLDTTLNDTLIANLWHLRNTGASGGTVDADTDTTMAWDITQGAATTVIAILENGGFDTAHPDLTPNLWANPGETAANGVDDDGNGFTDDILGWDFAGCTSPTTTGCGDNSPVPATATTEDHGTAVAGVAGARGNNMLGIAGSCPNCRIMLLRTGYAGSDWAKSLAFGYAQSEGAQLINNSWGGGINPNTDAAINTVATTGRGGLGTVVLFAAGNSSVNVCTGSPLPTGSLPTVITVSGSTNRDRKGTGYAFGNCVDVLSPTQWHPAEASATGTLAITTTDRSGAAGYNTTNNPCSPGLSNPADNNYTNCFNGTSSASPLAAGITALVLTVNPALTRTQVQNLIQDTTDRIEDSVGRYADANGFSTPVSGTATHSWGRINAFEAVRVAAPAPAGRAGVDLLIRDNRLDWGNTEQTSSTTFEPVRGFIPHWQSVDIKVDAPPYQPAPTNNASFEALTHENAESGSLNKVYVRVRNRGPVTASAVNVKLHWAFAGAGLPALPGDFWSLFPADSANTTIWHPLGVQPVANLAYSGSSIANTGADVAQIVAFDFNGPPVDATQPDPNHFCLFAVLDSPQDRALPLSRPTIGSDFVPDQLTPVDNNVTHRNIRVEDNDLSAFSDQFYVANPTDKQVRAILRINAPKGWRVTTDKLPLDKPFSLKPSERVLVSIRVAAPNRNNAVGDLTVIQETTVGREKIVGGLTYRFGYKRRMINPR